MLMVYLVDAAINETLSFLEFNNETILMKIIYRYIFLPFSRILMLGIS